ncbi:hypothetical protein MMC31_004760, partial [Peltigera leucophlebia]|nr:hypothetical protein [Peltigera leucophlebia]
MITTKIDLRSLYANASLNAAHALNDEIERKYIFAIILLKLELLVGVVDRSGALLFKWISGFPVDPSLFANFFAVCFYNSTANLGLRPDIIRLANELIEMNVGGKMIQASVKRECRLSKDQLVGRATTIRCVSYKGDFLEKLVKSWHFLGEVERPRPPAMLEMLARRKIQNIQQLVCYSTGEISIPS